MLWIFIECWGKFYKQQQQLKLRRSKTAKSKIKVATSHISILTLHINFFSDILSARDTHFDLQKNILLSYIYHCINWNRNREIHVYNVPHLIFTEVDKYINLLLQSSIWSMKIYCNVLPVYTEMNIYTRYGKVNFL
jgi:hypothetical protein